MTAAGPTGPEALVVGVGNPYRRDDGVALAVLEQLAGQVPPGVSLVEETGEPAALVTRWAGHPFVILVDAISGGAPAGTLHRLECRHGVWTVPRPSSSASTHGLGIAEAVALGKALGRVPNLLVLLGVEAGDVSSGVGLSDAVAASVAGVVSAVLHELEQSPAPQAR